MENKGTNIDDLFKDGLGDYTESPPPAAWNRLEKKLDGVQTRKPGKYYRWLGYFGMVSLLLLLGASVGRNLTSYSTYTANDAAIGGDKSKKKNSINSKNGNLITTTENQTSNGINVTAETELKSTPGSNDNQAVTGKPMIAIADVDKASQNKKGTSANRNRSMSKYAASHSNQRNKNGRAGNENDDQDENIYNSNTSGTTSTNISQNTKKQPVEKSKEVAAATPKASPQKLLVTNNNKEAAKQKTRPYFPRFELGVKAGYETGFDNDAEKKAVVSPYVQYNLTPKWAVMLQPSVKSAFLSSRIIGNPQSYYKVNDDGNVSVKVIPGYDANTLDTVLLTRYYTYSQTHDSIVKISSIGGTYMEFEIPVLLKYNISKKFSVYGGVNVLYGKLISVAENTNISKPITQSAPTTYTINEYHQAAPTPVINDSIHYTGNPISNYTGPQYPATNSSLLRYGYMLGFTYQYDKRWLFDALVQKASVPTNVQGGYNINTALSSAYLRLTIGYKLIK